MRDRIAAEHTRAVYAAVEAACRRNPSGACTSRDVMTEYQNTRDESAPGFRTMRYLSLLLTDLARAGRIVKVDANLGAYGRTSLITMSGGDAHARMSQERSHAIKRLRSTQPPRRFNSSRPNLVPRRDSHILRAARMLGNRASLGEIAYLAKESRYHVARTLRRYGATYHPGSSSSHRGASYTLQEGTA